MFESFFGLFRKPTISDASGATTTPATGEEKPGASQQVREQPKVEPDGKPVGEQPDGEQPVVVGELDGKPVGEPVGEPDGEKPVVVDEPGVVPPTAVGGAKKSKKKVAKKVKKTPTKTMKTPTKTMKTPTKSMSKKSMPKKATKIPSIKRSFKK